MAAVVEEVGKSVEKLKDEIIPDRDLDENQAENGPNEASKKKKRKKKKKKAGELTIPKPSASPMLYLFYQYFNRLLVDNQSIKTLQ